MYIIIKEAKMQIQITGKNIEVSQALKTITEEKFNKLKNHNANIMRVHIVFEVDKLIHSSRASIHIPGQILNAKSNSENLYKAIDLLLDKVNRQLRDMK